MQVLSNEKGLSWHGNFTPGDITDTKIRDKTVTAFFEHVEGSHMQLECLCNMGLHSII